MKTKRKPHASRQKPKWKHPAEGEKKQREHLVHQNAAFQTAVVVLEPDKNIYMSTTTSITAAEINKLRQVTGAGMMDCRKALVESDGDFEKAIDYLRKKGQKVAALRSDREAKEGVIIAKTTADQKTG